jgi:hypothetical protein
MLDEAFLAFDAKLNNTIGRHFTTLRSDGKCGIMRELK